MMETFSGIEPTRPSASCVKLVKGVPEEADPPPPPPQAVIPKTKEITSNKVFAFISNTFRIDMNLILV
jgi:hypothetical protein